MSMCADRSVNCRALALGIGLALVCAEASAGTVVDKEQKPLAKAAAPTLRCWQYGRLVLEETGVALPSAEKGLKALVFPRQDGGRDSVYVFDLNQGMCTITGTPQPGEK